MKYFAVIVALFALVAAAMASSVALPDKEKGTYGHICSSPLPPPAKTPPCRETAYKLDDGSCPEGFEWHEGIQFCARDKQ